MPKGDKSSYTDKQKRQAEHIEESYKEKGVSEGEAEERIQPRGGQVQEGDQSGQDEPYSEQQHAQVTRRFHHALSSSFDG